MTKRDAIGMTFTEFHNFVRENINNGTFEVSNEEAVSDYSLLIQYAISQLGKERGYPFKATNDEIWQAMGRICIYDPLAFKILCEQTRAVDDEEEE